MPVVARWRSRLNDRAPSQAQPTGDQPRHRQMMVPVGFALLPQERSELLVNLDLNHRHFENKQLQFIVT